MKIEIPTVSSDGKPAGVVGKVCLSIFFAIFALMGLMFVVMIARDAGRTVGTYSWVETPCVILESGVQENVKESTPFRFTVKYSYTYANQAHTAETYQQNYGGGSDYAAAQHLADRFKAGASTICYVNPKNPAESILSRQSLWGCLAVLFPLIFVTIGVGGIYFVWRGKRERKQADGTVEPEPISAKATNQVKAVWILPAFFSVFFLIGVGITYPLFFRPMLRIEAAKSWLAVPCTIISSEIRSHRGDKSTTYSVDIFYRYTVNGREYKSNRYDFMGGSSSGLGGKQAVVNRYPPGSRATCYVNPADLVDAVLERGYTSDLWFGLIPGVFALVGATGMFFGTRYALRKRAEALGLHDARLSTLPRTTGDGLPVTLKPAASPPMKLIGITFFALFWNGIVSVFVWQVVKGWKTGHGEWALTLFMIPFVLVGLATIGGIVYYVLALFNPRPRLTVTPGAVPVGGKAEVAWEMSGRTDRISKFTIVLEGREEATYHSGKNDHTATNVFATITIAEIEDSREMMTGRAQLAIPADTMHSFASDNNKIVWTLKVRGDIPFWPDVSEDFKFTVLPAPLAGRGE